MQELKATKVKEKNSLKAKSLTALVAYPSPLADFFAFKIGRASCRERV